MSMKEEWRSVSTSCGEPFAMGQPRITGTATGELTMQESSVDSWDTKTLVSLSGKDASRTSANVNFRFNTLTGPTIYHRSTQFGQGTGPIFFTNIGCSGTESSLLECSRSVFDVTSCTHSGDVGVKCEGNDLLEQQRHHKC